MSQDTRFEHLKLLRYPFDNAVLMRNKKAIRRSLQANSRLKDIRIAVLGGSTTGEIVDGLELFLLANNFRPTFYQSEYGKYYEDIMFEEPNLKAFKPDLIYFHTTVRNCGEALSPTYTREQVLGLAESELHKLFNLWTKAHNLFQCPIVINNFEPPPWRFFGSLDAVQVNGRTRFINDLNAKIVDFVGSQKNIYLHDLSYLASSIGLDRWHDHQAWCAWKYAMAVNLAPQVAHSVSNVMLGILGLSKKCLVLDLDNTMWGGVIGDDGLDGIRLGREDAEGEAFLELQAYCKALKERGVILTVCSKNEWDNAKSGFSHDDAILKFEDFAAFKANWDPKHLNIQQIAMSIAIGSDSMVFLDDNPAERALVSAQLPEVVVPEVGSEVTKYLRILDRSGLFEITALSNEDLNRSRYYTDNLKRQELEQQFKSYDEYLASLQMTAEISRISGAYIERATQLANKTNQFNLTTRRFTSDEMTQIAQSAEYIAFYGRLTDRFGDNGLISIVIGHIIDSALHMDLWLMSCRVLKRGMEEAMFDYLVQQAQARSVSKIYGYFKPTAKNAMVKDFYQQLDFKKDSVDADSNSFWSFEVPKSYIHKNKFIEVNAK